ncbi:hypothetical protein NL676_025510 [Syzygium grande]|nr:hypothetical protein NL676_025510 [Syzygium grande]
MTVEQALAFKSISECSDSYSSPSKLVERAHANGYSHVVLMVMMLEIEEIIRILSEIKGGRLAAINLVSHAALLVAKKDSEEEWFFPGSALVGFLCLR